VECTAERQLGLPAAQPDNKKMNSFYMTLPSNSSLDYYPDNTLTRYVTKLPQLFDLDGTWEVGLSEIQFPISWANINFVDVALFILVWYKNSEGQYDRSDWVNVSPPPGHYESPEVLVRQINAKIERVEHRKNGVRFLYNEISKKVTVRFDQLSLSETGLQFTRPLAELLGFDYERVTALRQIDPPSLDDTAAKTRQRRHNVVEEVRGYKLKAVGGSGGYVRMVPEDALSYTASSVCDLQRGFYSLFVYCDIVEPVVVGDVRAPLLRVVNISGKEGLTISRIYQNVQYLPIQRKQFDTIEIDIRDDTGEKVAFERGKVIVVLHFRRRRPSYL
jgi:hypothetical protein